VRGDVRGTAQFAERFDPRADFEAEEPLPLSSDLEDAAPYPVDCLGMILGNACRAIMDKVQVPDGLAAQSVLGAASLAIQPFVDIRLPTSEIKPTCLFLTTVAASGDRKSSADGFALQGVRDAEADLWRRYQDDRREFDINLTSWKEGIARAKKSKGDIAAEMRAAGNEPRPPAMPIILATEGTIEGLQKLFAEARPSMGLFSDEGGVWLGGYGMNDDNRLKTGAALSEFWDGKPIKRVRAGEGLTLLLGRRLSFHMMIQPEIASKLLGDGELRGQGLLSRLLVTAPKSLAGTRMYRPLQPDTEANLETFQRRIYRIMSSPLPMDEETHELKPRAVPMAPDAERMWWGFADYCEHKIGPSGEWDAIRGVIGKLPEQAARLALVIAVFERGRESVQVLTGADLANGVKLAEFYAVEALRLLGIGEVDEATKQAERLIGWLKSDWPAPLVGLRHICKGAPRGLRKADQARSALGVLEKHGHVVRLPNGAEIGGQRHREAWRIVGVE
jgi:hypothetical protein